MNQQRILIAEDEEHLGSMVKFKMERAGYLVTWCMDGETALQSVRETLPDLAILDVMMPGLSGFEVLEAIKRDDGLRRLPVIMLTARGQESDVVKGLQLGAADYITKPFRPAELLARVQRVLAQD